MINKCCNKRISIAFIDFMLSSLWQHTNAEEFMVNDPHYQLGAETYSIIIGINYIRLDLNLKNLSILCNICVSFKRKSFIKRNTKKVISKNGNNW